MPEHDRPVPSIGRSLLTPLGAILARLRRPAAQPSLYLRLLPQRAGDIPKEAAEAFFTALHAVGTPLNLDVISAGGRLTFGLRCAVPDRPYIESQLAAQYPGVDVEEVPDESPSDMPGCSLSLKLAQTDVIPLRCSESSPADPLAILLAALAVVPADQVARISVVIQSLPDGWQKAGLTYATLLRSGQQPPSDGWTWLVTRPIRELLGLIPYALQNMGGTDRKQPKEEATHLDHSQQEMVRAIEEKAAWPGFRTAIRLDVWAASQADARQTAIAVASAFQHYSLPYLNRLVQRTQRTVLIPDDDLLRRHAFILSVPELAALWHLPDQECTISGVAWATTRRAEPPAILPAGHCALVARTAFRADRRLFGIQQADRFRHLYIVGKAGTGKSTLIKNLISQDMHQGHGLALLDPHGDLYQDLLDCIPADRLKDVVLLDPGDQEYPVSLNVLELPDSNQKAQVASALVDILKRSFEHSWGPRLEYILRNCILTLLEVPNSTIMGIPRLLSDEGYRAWVVAKVQDPIMRFFWQREFAAMLTNPRLVTEAISPVQNKVGQFLSAPLLRHILAQPKSTIDIQDIMEKSKILLVNLAKGRIGEDSSALLGAMILSSFHFAAMRRVAQPEQERRSFFLYADEFQSFATSTFASILSEARKYRLGLILAHQYIAQLPDEVRDAIFGNVGSLVAFAVGPDDARFLAREVEPALTAEDLVNLDRYHMAVRLMVDGTATPAFSAAALPPTEERTGLREKAIAASRARYAREVSLVETKIRTWSERIYHAPRQSANHHHAPGGPRAGLPRFPLLPDGRRSAVAPATLQIADRGE